MTESGIDDYLHLLSRSQRRGILESLLGHPESAIRFEDCLGWKLDKAEFHEEFTRQLDILERAGVVEYDESERVVSQGDAFEDIEPFVRAVASATETHDFERERDQLELINRGLRHDLLNSLNIVRARVSMLDDGETTDPDRDHHAVVEEQIEEMITRVQTMGSFTEAVVSGGDHELDNRNLRDAIDPEVTKLQHLNPDADVRQDEIPDAAVAADKRLSLLFENLLRNALEHNDTDAPTVRITGQCLNGDVEVTVVDDGPGIPEEVRTELFEDEMLSGESGGGGFGLHFVKRTVDDYGGEITIADRNPRGTAVTVRLPRGEAGD